MSKRTIILIAVIIVLAVLGYVYIREGDTTSTTEQKTNQNQPGLTEVEKAKLGSDVYAAVDQKTAGVWDKHIETIQIDTSSKAAHGAWVARDHWPWIAWKTDSTSWRVLVNLDGFDCNELKEIPPAYNSFFSEVTHTPSGELYCYDHTQRK